jgi:hypothetical protein
VRDALVLVHWIEKVLERPVRYILQNDNTGGSHLAFAPNRLPQSRGGLKNARHYAATNEKN